MAAKFDLETRIRRYAEDFDREVPTTAMLERRIMARVAITPRAEPRGMSLPRQLALAGILVITVALIAVGAFRLRTMNQSVTAHQRTSLVNGPGTAVISAFVSPNLGWIAEMQPATNAKPVAGPTVLFATTDGGRHWKQQLTWDGPPPVQMRFTADGKEGLIVGVYGVPLYHTVDGGVSWQRMALPAEVAQGEGGAQVYFLDTRQGWVMSYLQEATPGFVGLFHTTDSGAHWTRIARVDAAVVFNYGQNGGSTQGSLVFTDSSTGWLIPSSGSGTGITPTPTYLYTTRDGGLTWKVETITPPPGTQLDSSSAVLSAPVFFDARDGVLGLTPIQQVTSGSGAPQPPSLQPTYVYTTSDGGGRWTYAERLPAPVVTDRSTSFIDSQRWIVFDGTRLMGTTDGGQHWSAIPGGLPQGWIPVILTFTDASHGWAVTYQRGPAPPRLYRTSDGGSHWSEVTLPTTG